MFVDCGSGEDEALHCRANVVGKKKKVKSNQDEDAEWTEKFGAKGAKIIRETVDANIQDYEYLKQFALKA